MEQVVVDSSVAIKWFMPEPFSTEARRVLRDYEAGTLTLLAPDLINAEVGNIIWKKHIFQGVTAADAQDVLNAFRAISFTLTSGAILLDTAYQIAIAHQGTVYDAIPIADQGPYVSERA